MKLIMPAENEFNQLPVQPTEFSRMETASELPQPSARFGKVPNDAEDFGTVRNTSERREDHTLTVRETARMFETAGVARTERSIINWCQPNRQGITRLDCYYDPNERKYYITPQSVEAVIQEEIQRAKKTSEMPPSEPFGSPVTHVKHAPDGGPKTISDDSRIQELEREVLDLKITNRGKDMFIEQLKNERSDFFEKLLTANRTVGQLETKLNQLAAPEL